jgi:hypothetical protein
VSTGCNFGTLRQKQSSAVRVAWAGAVPSRYVTWCRSGQAWTRSRQVRVFAQEPQAPVEPLASRRAIAPKSQLDSAVGESPSAEPPFRVPAGKRMASARRARAAVPHPVMTTATLAARVRWLADRRGRLVARQGRATPQNSWNSSTAELLASRYGTREVTNPKHHESDLGSKTWP